MVKNRSTSRIITSVILESFGVKDAKGRVMGAQATLLDVEFEGGGVDFESPPGRCYGFQPHTTRDGRVYGPNQPDRYFPTVESRDDEVRRYFFAARRRAK
jgi:hypothetical protein